MIVKEFPSFRDEASLESRQGGLSMIHNAIAGLCSTYATTLLFKYIFGSELRSWSQRHGNPSLDVSFLMLTSSDRAAFYPTLEAPGAHPFFPSGIGQLTMFAGEFGKTQL